MVSRHQLSDQLLHAFARGGGGAGGMTVLADIWHSRNLTLIAVLADLAGRNAGARPVAMHAMAVLAATSHSNPAVVRNVLSYPTVSAWLSASVGQLRRGTAADAGANGLARIAATAAVRAGLDAELPLLPDEGPLLLPSLGRADFPRLGGTLRVETAPRGTVLHSAGDRIPMEPGGGWHDVPIIEAKAGALRLWARFDGSGWQTNGNPLGIPVLGDGADRLGWQAGIAAGWQVLSAHHRAVAQEIEATLSVIVPLGRTGPGMVSGTFRKAFGAIAMSKPDDPCRAAVTLAHEVQHGKLAVIMEALPLLDDDGSRRYRVQWREDPRPLAAVLQGTYAHLGVAAFWRRQREVAGPERDRRLANAEFDRWRVAAREGIDILLASQALTPAGALFVQEMRHSQL